jgi:hypothetical protein
MKKIVKNILHAVSLFGGMFLLMSSSKVHAVRPFVTDDARIIDVYQIEVETWTELQRSSSEKTVGQHFMGGLTVNDWLEIIGGGGAGYDFDNDEFLVTNPVLQPKILLWQAAENGVPGMALATGLMFPTGRGEAYFDDATSYYFLALFTSRLFDDWLQVHLNLGRTYAKVSGATTDENNYWGIGLDVGVYDIDYRWIVEAYSGDPFEAFAPDLAFQSGFRWLKSDTLNFDVTFGTQPELNDDLRRSGKWEVWAQFGIRLLFDTFRGDRGPGDPFGAKGMFSF